MLRKLLITWIGIASIFSVVFFSEVSLSASDSESEIQEPASENIVKFTITPAKLWMYPGGSIQLIAAAYDSNGKKVSITPEWSIKSEISSFGEFDKPEGERVIFSALNSGNGLIVAVYNNIEAEVHVKIFKKGE